MNKCKCYDARRYYDQEKDSMEEYGYCLGTKDCETCTCGGDPAKCDFYAEKRKKNEMETSKTYTTAEMWLKAQEDGNWYNCVDILYNKKYGFISKITLRPWYDESDEEERGLFDIDCFLKNKWRFCFSAEDSPIMTRAEAEDKFGIKIVV